MNTENEVMEVDALDIEVGSGEWQLGIGGCKNAITGQRAVTICIKATEECVQPVQGCGDCAENLTGEPIGRVILMTPEILDRLVELLQAAKAAVWEVKAS